MDTLTDLELHSPHMNVTNVVCGKLMTNLVKYVTSHFDFLDLYVYKPLFASFNVSQLILVGC